MQHDIWKFSALLIISALIGLILEHMLSAILITALGIIAWQIYRLNQLYLWVINPRDNHMIESSGLLYQLHREIARRNNQNIKQKRKLATYVSQFRKAAGALPDAIILIDDFGKIAWANSNSKAVLGIRWPEDSEVRFGDLIRYPEVDKLLKNKVPPDQGVIVNSLRDKDQIINIKCVRYTHKLRMIVARDVSRLIKINQMHTDFVADVSHELKTPLTVLRGYLEILRGAKSLPKEFAQPLDQMNAQSLRMQFLVGDLLYLARLEDNENIKPKTKVDVTQLINAIIEAVQPLIEEKRHKLELDINYNLVINGTQSELHSAFNNLITNAINYTPRGGLINIRWQMHGHSAIFSVTDNGIGIPSQHLDRLTQRFYRVDADRSREGGGTGLGLAIVKHVLQRHDAELDIDSTDGVGSVFKCIFPKSIVVNQQQASEKQEGQG